MASANHNMEYITGNYKFEQYLGRYIDLNVDGVVKKFYVGEIGDTSHVQASSYIFGNRYAIEGLAENQWCSVPPTTSSTTETTGGPTSSSTTQTSSTTQSPCNQLGPYFYANTTYMSSCNGSTLAPDMYFNTESRGTAYASTSPACNLYSGTVFIGYDSYTFAGGVLASTGSCLPPTTVPPSTTQTSTSSSSTSSTTQTSTSSSTSTVTSSSSTSVTSTTPASTTTVYIPPTTTGTTTSI